MSNPFASSTAKSSNPFAAASNPFAAATQQNPFAAASASVQKPKDEEDVVDENYNPEEECQAEFKPLVSLPEIQVKPVEEEEESLFEARSKLFRFDNASNTWKERGTGKAYVLKNPESGLVRFLFRQEQTLKIRSNHYIAPSLDLQPHGSSDRAFIWRALDYADGESSADTLAIRFPSAEVAESFEDAFIAGQNTNSKQEAVDLETEEAAETSEKEEETAEEVKEVDVETEIAAEELEKLEVEEQ
ncbi:hypothetical protein GEMRC1_002931 [Eukaryota sp. GEM-RC1]